jgi:primosomal protein N' (replication factor Y)
VKKISKDLTSASTNFAEPLRSALVAVETAVPGLYSYLIPQNLEILVGQMVLVPFGNRKLIGYVLKISYETFDFPLKPIEEVLRPEPLFHEDFYPFIDFISNYYHYPPGLCVKEIIPGGLAPKITKKLVLTDIGLNEALDPSLNPTHPFVLLKNAYPEPLLVNSFQNKTDLSRINQLVANKLASFKYVVDSKALSFSYELIIHRAEDLPQKMPKLGKNEASFWERIKNSPPTPLSHFRNFYSDALRIARNLEKKRLIAITRSEIFRDDPSRALELNTLPVDNLTSEQSFALGEINKAQEKGQSEAFLLFGVTGSGKTEIYLRASQKALAEGPGVLWLTPEIALTMGLEGRIKRALSGIPLAVLHSRLNPGQRHDHWQNLARGTIKLALGARSAVFAPVANLGLIVVDEEHDWAYKQEDGLKYNGRDLAAWRARQSSAVLILGSATPSLESYQGSLTGRLKLLTLTERPQGASLPIVELCDLKGAPKGQTLTPYLKSSLTHCFSRQEQALLFINRKGYASYPVCLSCGEPLRCPNCSLTLTIHGPKSSYIPIDTSEPIAGIPQGSQLICHGCGYRAVPSKLCPTCGATMMRFLGIGTEKLMDYVEKEFSVKGLRFDAESTRKKGGFKDILESFGNRKAHFMVGTQMAAKGHDFSNLTVVGVVDADIGLNLPDFRAAERTHQLLSQVSGRAGRAEKPGKVIIQTLNPNHYAIQAAKNHDYKSFFQEEILMREKLNLPPFGRIALLRFSSLDEKEAEEYAQRAKTLLVPIVKELETDAGELWGPAPAPISRLKERYRFQLMVRTSSVRNRHKILKNFLSVFLRRTPKTLIFTLDVDPYHLM